MADREQKTKARTKRVRMLVAINALGQWTCTAGSHCEGEEKQWVFLDDMESGEHYYWVVADIPIPDNEIKGTVSGEVVTP